MLLPAWSGSSAGRSVCVLTHQSGRVQIDVSSLQAAAAAHQADSPQEPLSVQSTTKLTRSLFFWLVFLSPRSQTLLLLSFSVSLSLCSSILRLLPSPRCGTPALSCPSQRGGHTSLARGKCCAVGRSLGFKWL